jgi:hypothetical protein
MKYGRLVVFIRYASAEIWGVCYGLTLVIGTLKIMASTGVFERVVFALKHSLKKPPSRPSMYFHLNKESIKPQPPKDGPWVEGEEGGGVIGRWVENGCFGGWAPRIHI